MAGKNDKWVMFRNYMHNELGITKEDIREWIEDSVKQEVKAVVNNQFKYWNLREITENEIRNILIKDYDLKNRIYEQIMSKMKFEQ